jgi:hypothetical protein
MGKRSPRLVGFGFLGIGIALLAIVVFMATHAVPEARIGRALVDTGEPTEALVVSVARIERSQCSRSQRFICTSSMTIIGTVLTQVDGQRTATEARLTSRELATYDAGQDLFIDLIYLPTDLTEVERAQGDRLSAAQSSMLSIYVLAAFALTFTLIGGVTLLVARKRAPRPSTAPND